MIYDWIHSDKNKNSFDMLDVQSLECEKQMFLFNFMFQGIGCAIDKSILAILVSVCHVFLPEIPVNKSTCIDSIMVRYSVKVIRFLECVLKCFCSSSSCSHSGYI